MRALFITTRTVDCANHVRAWDSFSPIPAEHFMFDHLGIRNDWQMIDAAEKIKPTVIFYIGAVKSLGTPKPDTFRALRKIAPLVNLCSDAADTPWHPILNAYRKHQCFDLQVAIDGKSKANVDLATVTPVDPRPFEGEMTRDIRCGFSGTIGRWNVRSETINALTWFGGLTVRAREGCGTYEDHARFMKRCRMLLNISFTGSQMTHHIKGRVLEAGWAGCALLESEGSPIGDWFPADCYMIYRNPKEAAEIIATIDDAAVDGMAKRLAEEVRSKFHPAMIYGQILRDALGSGRGMIEPHVADPVAAPAA